MEKAKFKELDKQISRVWKKYETKQYKVDSSLKIFDTLSEFFVDIFGIVCDKSPEELEYLRSDEANLDIYLNITLYKEHQFSIRFCPVFSDDPEYGLHGDDNCVGIESFWVDIEYSMLDKSNGIELYCDAEEFEIDIREMFKTFERNAQCHNDNDYVAMLTLDVMCKLMSLGLSHYYNKEDRV